MAINRTQLIERIKKIEGLTNDERSSLLELLRSTPKYGLVWENKPEDVETQMQEELPVLTEVKERAIISDAPDAPNHILIEGDNLHALTALSYTHEGKIDVIYIDPPYNTGNKDFVYNDSYVDREDGYRHSKWLSFMNKRLKIAKRLLSDRGVIFISIDDNEQAQLKLLCDEVFGEQNCVATFIIIRSEGGGLAKQAVIGHDYLLVYAKSIEKFTPLRRNKDIRGQIVEWQGETYWIETDWLRKEFGKYGTCFYEEILTYFNQEKKDEIDRGLAIGHYRLIRKGEQHIVGRLRKVAEDGSKLYTIQKHLNKDGLQVLRDLNLADIFSYPKPVSLTKDFIYGSTFFAKDKKATILDFFAGSGTTLHATMQLNAEDGGRRQCILVTNNENGICENVTYERNRRVIQGYTTPKGVDVAGLADNTLRYYRTDFVAREPNHHNKVELIHAATAILCIKEGLYEETAFCVGGRKLRKTMVRRFTNGKRDMLIVYEPAVISLIVEELKNWDGKEQVKIYLFSEGQYAYNDDFREVIGKVELCALPDAIYQAYRRVMPKRKAKELPHIDLNEDEVEEALNDNYTYNDEKGGEA